MAGIANYAASIGIRTPLFTASIPVYNAAQIEGHGGEDTAAVCAVLERMAGFKRWLISPKSRHSPESDSVPCEGEECASSACIFMDDEGPRMLRPSP